MVVTTYVTVPSPALNKDVMNINLLDTTTGRLYGLHRNRKSYLVSDDAGGTWWGIAETDYVEAMAGSVTNVTALPYVNGDVETLSEKYGMKTDYGFRWGGGCPESTCSLAYLYMLCEYMLCEYQ